MDATTDHDRLDTGRLWAGGSATALVAALIAVAGIVITRGVFGVPVLAPKGDGVWGNANTVTYAFCAAGGAFAATGLLHLLLVTTPRPGRFFTWFMILLTAIGTALPLTLGMDSPSVLATAVINFVIGIATLTILNGVARSAQRR